MTAEKITQRNEWLSKFFKTIFPDKILIVNSIDNPAVIYNHSICLSCYVQNIELRLMDKPRGGNIICSITLSETMPEYDIETILHWFKDCEHRSIFKLALQGTTPLLYLSGYNFTDRINSKGKFPVFSRHNPKVYMTKDNAQKVLDSLKGEGYDVVPC